MAWPLVIGALGATAIGSSVLDKLLQFYLQKRAFESQKEMMGMEMGYRTKEAAARRSATAMLMDKRQQVMDTERNRVMTEGLIQQLLGGVMQAPNPMNEQLMGLAMSKPQPEFQDYGVPSIARSLGLL